jgi:hypothetical protein
MARAWVVIACAGCGGPTVGTLAAVPLPYHGQLELIGEVDTDHDPRCLGASQSEGPDLCVISATDIEVGDTIAWGDRALVLVAGNAITVTGTLDVSAYTFGAAANSSDCEPAKLPAEPRMAGGGGRFGDLGAPAVVTHVRGGCKGGCDHPDSSRSGGAVYLLARQQILVTGNVFAAGAPGTVGFSPRVGGCGGGSGGLIAFEAPTVEIAGIVAANGGGGSMGNPTEGNFGGTATAAEDGTTFAFDTPARGGTTEFGGNGGDGGALNDAAKPGRNDPAAGRTAGGEGGSVGAIWVKGALTGTRISPAPTLEP